MNYEKPDTGPGPVEERQHSQSSQSSHSGPIGGAGTGYWPIP